MNNLQLDIFVHQPIVTNPTPVVIEPPKHKTYVLRDYQREASDAAVNFFNGKLGNGNAIMVLPTGSGKSLCIADIASRIDGKLLVFQPSKEILEQNYDKYRSYGFYDCAIYSASLNKKNKARVTFATIGSVMSHPELFDEYEHIVVDEAHLVNSKGGRYKEFFEMGDRHILGLTATPYRLQSYEMGCILKFLTRTRPRIFSKMIYQVPIQKLMADGYLAKLRYFDMQLIDVSNVRKNSTGQDYDEESLRKAYKAQDMNRKPVEVVNRLRTPKDGSKRRGILVFTRFIEESEWLVGQLGNCAAIVTGETPKKERERILKDFKRGRLEVVANVNCLDENTEILTRQGWVGIDTIADQDIAQYDNGVITFAKADKIIKNNGYSDDYVSVNGRYLNIRVTKNHRMIYAKRKRGGGYVEHIDYAGNIVGKSGIFIPVSGYAQEDVFDNPAAAISVSERRFINYNAYNYRKKGYSHEEAETMAKQLYERRLAQRAKAPHELTLDECRFIGFFLGDGTITNDTKGGKKYSFVQSLSTPKMCEWAECLMKKCGINYSEEKRTPSSRIVMGRECRVSDYKRYTLYLGTGGDKQYVPSNLYKLVPYLNKNGNDMLWGLNKVQLFALTEGLFKANGWHGNNKEYKGGEKFIVSSKQLSDLLQAIGTCRGFRVMVSTMVRGNSKPLYHISVSDHRYHEMARETLQFEQHDKAERTWCVSVPTGKIITRRNGRVVIMGNCLTTGFDYPELDTVVMARPTMSLALWYQCVGRGIRSSEGKNGWLVDMCGNIGRFGKVDDLELMEETPGRGTWCVYGRVGGVRKQLTNIFF